MSSLRRTYQMSSAVLGALLVVTSLALVGLTAELNRATGDVVRSLECIQSAESIHVGLLRYAQLGRFPNSDPRAAAQKPQIRAEIGRQLQATRSYADSSDKKALVDRAERSIRRFFAAADGSAGGQVSTQEPLDDAAAAIGQLAALNRTQARQAREVAGSLDLAGNIVGGVVLLTVAGLAVGTLFGLRRVYRPVSAVGTAIRRFVYGERSARAPESGPAELQEISRTFNSAADMLERQLGSVAAIAHDLKNPLTSIKIASSMLERDAGSPEAIRKRSALLRAQVGRLEQMVSDLLDSSQIEAGQVSMRYHKADLSAILEEVVSLFPPEDARRIVLHTPARRVELRCDPLRVEQVLANLLSNALKYSRAPLPVDVDVVPGGRGVTVCVIDRGEGIPASEQAAIFEPFHRSPSAARSPVPGAGLGLSITRRLVEAHGGWIEVDSHRGQGAMFRVWLPWSPPVESIPLAPAH